MHVMAVAELREANGCTASGRRLKRGARGASYS